MLQLGRSSKQEMATRVMPQLGLAPAGESGIEKLNDAYIWRGWPLFFAFPSTL
jgi:hypothetical protein